jgi:predicted TIM-barrel fold metal-dependent hydrolase
LDEEREIFGPWEAANLELTPTEYFKRQGYASVDVDEYLAAHTVEQLGPDNLVLSTDYPHHDSAYPHALDIFLEMDGFSRETKEKILWDNCVRLYNLPS